MTLRKWYCPTHGYLCEASVNAEVRCGHSIKKRTTTGRCNKRAVDYSAFKAQTIKKED
jgi:hypothetical protein